MSASHSSQLRQRNQTEPQLTLPDEMREGQRETQFTPLIRAYLAHHPEVSAAVMLDPEGEWVDFVSRWAVDDTLLFAAQCFAPTLGVLRAGHAAHVVFRRRDGGACLASHLGDGYALWVWVARANYTAAAQREALQLARRLADAAGLEAETHELAPPG